MGGVDDAEVVPPLCELSLFVGYGWRREDERTINNKDILGKIPLARKVWRIGSDLRALGDWSVGNVGGIIGF